MTIEDAKRFVDEARELEWRPEIWIIGGEPTLHSQFLDFVEIACGFGSIRVMSNHFTDESRSLLGKAEKLRPGCVRSLSAKPTGAVDHFRRDYCIAPRDFDACRVNPCHVHSGYKRGCGISVDHEGYTVCPNGGAIDGIHKLGIRTKKLADLFDPEFAAKQTEVLCGQYCGCEWVPKDDPTSLLCERYNIPVSPTWKEAFEV
jgi:hypothetical protein